MTAPSVIHADEWWLDGSRYPLIGPIQVQTLNILPPRVTTGVSDRDQEQIRSSVIYEDWAGGLGILNGDSTTQPDRYAYGTLDTRRRRTASLLPLATEASTDAPAGTRLRCMGTYFETLYGAWDTTVRFWSDAGANWNEPPEGSYVDLSANGTSILSMRLNSKDYIIFADADGTLRFDGSTWTYQAGDGALTPNAEWLAEWDSRLWALDSNGLLWDTTDFATWTKKAQLPLVSGEAQGLTTFFTQDNVSVLHSPTRSGLWIYNPDDDRWERTRLEFDRTARGGVGAKWRGDWFSFAGLDGYEDTANVISPMGLSRDDGLPPDSRGDITAVAATANWLVVGVTGTDTDALQLTDTTASGPWRVRVLVAETAFSALYAWNGAGWHPLWQGTDAATQIDCIAPVRASDSNRLWWGVGGTAFYQQMPVGIFNPRDEPTWPFAESGDLVTQWLAPGGKSEVPKLACDGQLALAHADADNSGAVSYAIDGDTNWTSLIGAQVTDTADPTTFNGGAGLVFHKIRFKFALQRGSDDSEGPDLDWFTFTYLPELRRLYRVTATIDLSDQQHARRLEAALQTTIEKEALLESSFRHQGQSVGPSGRVFLILGSGLTGTGAEIASGRWTVQVVSVA